MSLFGKSRVVLALGGGGSRGLAHLGVLRVLAREGIPIDGVVGTSVGAIVAGAYANAPDVEELIEGSLDYLRSDRFQKDQFRRVMFGANDVEASPLASLYRGIRKSLSFTALIRRKSVFAHERLAEVVAEFVPDVDFEELAIPFGVPAIDLKQPREVMLTEGSLRTAVTASCSLPGFFPPVELDDMLLADVGVIGSVPVDAARELMPGALVIAVDLSTELEPIEEISRGWEAILRCEVIASQKLKDLELERADVVVRPRLGAKYWSDFTELQRMIDAGAVATEAVLPDIRSKLEGIKRFLRVKNPSHHESPHDDPPAGSGSPSETETTETGARGVE